MDDLVIVTPWYPTQANPMWGTFVLDAVTTLRRHHPRRVTVVHIDGNPRLPDEVDAGESWSWIDERPEARVVRIRVPMDALTPRHQAILNQRAAAERHALDHLRAAQCVSAHVGAPTAAAIAPLLAPHTRFVITEHAHYVKAVFNDEQAAADYRAAAVRADVLTVVGDSAATVLRRLLGADARVIRVVPNPVRIDDVPPRSEPMRHPERWLYVGSLTANKGVDTLVDSFATAVDRAPERPWRLTLVGDGPLRESLEQQVADAGLTERVTFTGVVPPAAVGAYYAEHDVLVHLSQRETFGITCIEAAASGMPVVVTRCGGPQETMALPEALGLCAFVPVGPAASDVVDAVESLRRDISREDLHVVREALRSFYGVERVADLLAVHVLGTHPEAPYRAPGRLRIAVVHQSPQQWGRLVPGVQRALDMGADITSVDLARMTTRSLSIGDAVGGVVTTQNSSTGRLRRTQRFITDRAPKALLRRAGRLADRLPEPRRAPAHTAVARARTLHSRISARIDQELQPVPWKLVRESVTDRRAGQTPATVIPRDVDVIVHGGGHLARLAYGLCDPRSTIRQHAGPFSGRTVGQWWADVLRNDR